MAGILVNIGLDWLDSHTPSSDSATWKVQLYSSNTTPAAADTLATYTLISTVGLIAQTPGFTFNAAAAGSKTIVSALMNFVSNASSGLSIYGYVVIASDGTTLLGAEKFAGGPYTIPSAGAGVQLTVTLTDSSP